MIHQWSSVSGLGPFTRQNKDISFHFHLISAIIPVTEHLLFHSHSIISSSTSDSFILQYLSTETVFLCGGLKCIKCQMGSLTNNLWEPLALLSQAHTVPLFPNTQLRLTVSTACTDLILAAVSSLARATWKTKKNYEKERWVSLQITADRRVRALFPSLRSVRFFPRSWLGSDLESTQAELVHCNWMLGAGRNCSHLPKLDVSADDGRFRVLSLLILLPRFDLLFLFFLPFSLTLYSNSDLLL